MTGEKRPGHGSGEEPKGPDLLLPELPAVPELRPKLPPKERPSEDGAELRRRGLAWTIPSALIAPIVVLTLLGSWLDGRFGTGSAWTAGGAILGTISGFINMIRLADRLNR
jgi:F0F1-type ATP synthase assembly protein I